MCIQLLNAHNSNSKPVTYNPNPTVTQKLKTFCLVTKLIHMSQLLSLLFGQNGGAHTIGST